MSKYRIYYQAVISRSVEVDAVDYDDAVDKGYEQLPLGLCWQCTDQAGDLSDWEEDTKGAGGYYCDDEWIEVPDA